MNGIWNEQKNKQTEKKNKKQNKKTTKDMKNIENIKGNIFCLYFVKFHFTFQSQFSLQLLLHSFSLLPAHSHQLLPISKSSNGSQQSLTH